VSPPRKASAPEATGAQRRVGEARNSLIFAPHVARVNAPSVRPLVVSLPRATWSPVSRHGGRR